MKDSRTRECILCFFHGFEVFPIAAEDEVETALQAFWFADRGSHKCPQEAYEDMVDELKKMSGDNESWRESLEDDSDA